MGNPIDRAKPVDRTFELVDKHNPGKYDKDLNLMKQAVSDDLRTHDGLEWRGIVTGKP